MKWFWKYILSLCLLVNFNTCGHRVYKHPSQMDTELVDEQEKEREFNYYYIKDDRIEDYLEPFEYMRICYFANWAG